MIKTNKLYRQYIYSTSSEKEEENHVQKKKKRIKKQCKTGCSRQSLSSVISFILRPNKQTVTLSTVIV